MWRSFRAMVDACHPLPSVAVTVFATAYALAVQDGLSAAGVRSALLVGAAIFTGQLCVGWSNDGFDA